MRWLPLLLLASCAPDYFGVKPYYGTGELVPRGGNALDTEDYGLMLEVGWDIGERRSMRDLTLEYSRFEAGQRDEPPAVVEVNTGQEEASLTAQIAAKPGNTEEGWAFIQWAAGLLILAVAAKVSWPLLSRVFPGKKRDA